MKTYPLDPDVRFTLYGSPRGVHIRGDVGKWVFEMPMNGFPKSLWSLIDAAQANRRKYEHDTAG